jgi:hypothetical protein
MKDLVKGRGEASHEAPAATMRVGRAMGHPGTSLLRYFLKFILFICSEKRIEALYKKNSIVSFKVRQDLRQNHKQSD